MTTIKVRRGTATQWANANTVLAAGEPGQDTTTGVIKVGDGSTAWANLLPTGGPTQAIRVTDATSSTLTGTLVAGHLTPIDATAGAAARTLPAASSVAAGGVTAVKKADTSANAVTVSRAGSDVIFGTGSGATTRIVTLPGEAVVFTSNGVNAWTVMASDTPVAQLDLRYPQLLITDATSSAASGTLVAWHLTPVDATSAASTWTLPAANSVTAGVETAVKKADTSANTVTVSRAGSDLIFGTGSGATTKTLSLAGEAVTLVSDGVSKWTVQTSDTPSGVLASTYGRPYLPGGWVSGSTGTRRAMFAWGGSGDTINSIGSLTDAHQRLPVQLPVTTSRWRLRIRNAKADGTSVAGAFNFTGVWVGQAAKNATTGMPTGAFTATPSQALTSFSTASDGASETVTGWVSDPTLQLSANTQYLVSAGWTTSATQTARSTGIIFYSAGAGKSADASVTSPSLSTASDVQVGYWALEYEFSGSNRIGIAIGDSLTEGYGGGTNTIYNQGTWHQWVSRRLHLPMCSAAVYGSVTSDWTSSSAWKWTRWTGATLNIDFAVIDLGANDANTSVSLATYQANVSSIVTNLRAAGINDIYFNTVAPRALSTTPEAIRVSYNTWLKSGPYGTLGVFDVAEALQDPADVTALRADYLLGGDTVHWSAAAHHRAGTAVGIA